MKKRNIFKKIKEQKILGFTLIELLVVIAIIGLLTSIVLSNLQLAKMRGRDAKRSAETRQLLNALALSLDSNGKFPCHYYIADDDSTFLKAFIDRGLLPAAPRDPSGGSFKYEYATMGNPGSCGDYAFLGVYFENPIAFCPTFGIVATDGPNHCHIWYPTPPPCSDLDINRGPIYNGTNGNCIPYADDASENSF